MKDLTRREFLNTAAGAVIGGTVIGHAAFLNAAVVDTPSTIVDSSISKCAGLCVPIEPSIFPNRSVALYRAWYGPV